MKLLSIEKDKFYGMIKCGEIENPIRLSPKDVFWYASYVKKKVEEHKKVIWYSSPQIAGIIFA